MEFTKIELLFLRRRIEIGLNESQGNLARYQRMSFGRYDGVFDEKKAMAESECSAMTSLLSRINDEIALMNLEFNCE